MPNDEDGAVLYQLVGGGDRLIRVASRRPACSPYSIGAHDLSSGKAPL